MIKVVLLVVIVTAATACLPGRTKADVLTAWNGLALTAIRSESTAPPLAARNLAILHGAIYDAVNSIDQTHEPYLLDFIGSSEASAEAAAVSAAYWTLIYLYPSLEALFDSELDDYLAGTSETTNRTAGLQIGETAALLMLIWRSSDGSTTTVPYIPGTDPGEWRRTLPFFRPPDLPQWPYVTPFAMTNGTQFRPQGPPLLTSTQYTRDFNLVQQLGGSSSTNRTAEQTLIARFWSDFSYTVTPPGHWNEIAQNVASNRGNTLAQNARLFALLNIAMADAGIAAWDAKYAYNFWRPVTAIREADTDGNPDTANDPTWSPLLNTPSFPEYTSGHSTFSAAAASVLAAFYESDQVTFTVSSDTVPGVLRSYDSFAAAAEEIGMSRIYGGIHFLSADLDGLDTGHRLGEYVFQNYLRPLAPRATLDIASSAVSSSMLIYVSGAAGHSYILESSSDLVAWQPLVTNTAPFTVEVTVQPERFSMQFYRALTASQ